MLNSYQFSAAKDLSETKALQKLVFESDGFKDFKEKASEITNIFNDQWLRVEMDVCRRNSIMAESFRKIEETKDLYPYWVYKTENDDRVRDEHAALEGLIFRVGDPEGDNVFPQNDYNCRCSGEPVDDRYLKEENKQVSKGEDYLNEKDPESGKPYVADNFRFNQSHQGAMPNNSSYSEVLSSANKGNAELFNMPSIPQIQEAEKLTGLTIDEARKVMAEFDFPQVQKDAVDAYTQRHFIPINGYLRGVRKEISAADEITSKNLSELIAKAPKVETQSFRGITLEDKGFTEFKNLKKGDIFTDKGFISTTYDKNIATQFSNTAQYQVEMTFKGKNGVLIENLSNSKAEKEIIFNKGSNFKVESIKIKEKAGIYGKIFVSLVEI